MMHQQQASRSGLLVVIERVVGKWRQRLYALAFVLERHFNRML